MNIAIYQPRVSYYVGGGEIIPLEHARFLVLHGHKVTLITTRASFIAESEYFKKFRVENKDIKIVYIDVPESLAWIYQIPPGVNWRRWHLESLRIGQLALQYFSFHPFDVVVVHNTFDVIGIPGGQKSVLHLHGYPPHVNSIYEACLALPDRLIAVSKYIKRQWQSMVKLNRCDVATNGIRSDYFVPNPTISKRYDILYIGRLIPVKGAGYLIEAVAKLRKHIPNLRVAIVGIGPEKKTLKTLTRKLGLSRQIKFVGYIDSDQLPDFYNSARMAVFPSFDREGILTTMLEAASCGLPVITTTACSMHEFLRHRKNGLLVRPKSSSALSLAILELYHDEKLRHQLGVVARKDIVTRWDWCIKIKAIEKIYEGVLCNN